MTKTLTHFDINLIERNRYANKCVEEDVREVIRLGSGYKYGCKQLLLVI